MHVDGFRFDLAATLARELHDVDRLSAFFDLIQQDPVVRTGEADRRAVGRGGGRLPGGELPAVVVGVERSLPRQHPRRVAGPAPAASTSSPRGSPAHRTSTRPAVGDPTPASTSSPPTTASRSPTSSRTTTSTTRRTARAAVTAPTTTGRGTAGSRARPTTRRSTSCVPANNGTSSPRCCSPRECRCCSRATRWVGPRAATTTPTRSTTRCRGCTGTSLDSDLLEFSRRLIAYRTANPVLHRRRFLRGHTPESDASPTDDVLPDSAWFTPAGNRDDRRRLAGRSRRDRAVAQRGSRRGRPPRRGDPGHHRRSSCSTPGRTTSTRRCRPPIWGRAWSRSFDTAIAQATAPVRFPAGAVVTVDGRSVVVLELLAEDVGTPSG